MSRNGVELLAGTDTGDPYVIPGAALHDELALLVTAGLTPAEALRTATSNAARYLNLEESFGTIDRGKSADLVILNANPLEDIKNTRRIWAVMVRGKLVDRKRLDAMLGPR
jgi:imidazolonepropionase-like amidohydrolase